MAADQVAGLVIAYEPIWAIGTGRTATAEDAQAVCASIRATVAEVAGADAGRVGAHPVRRLGQGATTPPELMGQADIDGALVGGASLDPDEFATHRPLLAVGPGQAQPGAPNISEWLLHSTGAPCRRRFSASVTGA